MVNAGMASACERSDNEADPCPTTVWGCVSLTEISTRVAIVAGLALIALLIVAWRKPARPRAVSPRNMAEWAEDEVEHDPAVVSPRQKALETAGLGAIAIFGGIMVAIVVSVSIAWIVTNFLNRL